jgi:sporadic carbohydrate cluster protein (TIGR04323 family)
MASDPAVRGYRGYCTSHSFGGFRIPVPVQNLILRDYAARTNRLFRLSINELNFPNCYLHLESLLRELPSLDGILMSSYFMLPPDQSHRRRIYSAVLDHRAELHFVLENTILRSTADADRLEDLFRIIALLPHCPQKLWLDPGLSRHPVIRCA